MPDNIVLTAGQEVAVTGARSWWGDITTRRARNRHAMLPKPVYGIAGLAGTGKTTIVKIIVREIQRAIGRELFVQYLGPTGKSAAVMRRKGNRGAVTLHRFAFICLGEYKNDEGEEFLAFQQRGALDVVPDLVVLDEGSMVGAFELDTLVQFGIPIIILGDHGQLEPVNSKVGYDLNNADVKLEEVMRQAEESNIIRAAMFLRSGKQLPERKYDDFEVIIGYPDPEELAAYAGLDGERQIICGRNATRRSINAEVRKSLGFIGNMPKKGEKLICKYNDHNRGIMNGEQFIVLEVPRLDPEFDSSEADDGETERWIIKVKSLDDGREVMARFNPGCFLSKYESEDYKQAMKCIGAWDFGYAITCHSAQGSEWPEGIVIDENVNGCNRAKWRYTAVTRFSRHVKYYR